MLSGKPAIHEFMRLPSRAQRNPGAFICERDYLATLPGLKQFLLQVFDAALQHDWILRKRKGMRVGDTVCTNSGLCKFHNQATSGLASAILLKKRMTPISSGGAQASKRFCLTGLATRRDGRACNMEPRLQSPSTVQRVRPTCITN